MLLGMWKVIKGEVAGGGCSQMGKGGGRKQSTQGNGALHIYAIFSVLVEVLCRVVVVLGPTLQKLVTDFFESKDAANESCWICFRN